MESLDYVLCVSTPYGGSVLCTSIYPACEILIGNATLYVDLLPLDMGHLNVILGMDGCQNIVLPLIL